MDGTRAYGTIKDGRVILDAPLPLADGTRVVVGAIPTTGGLTNSPTGPAEFFKTEEERRAAVEELVLETVRMRGSPAEVAALERLVREWRGAND